MKEKSLDYSLRNMNSAPTKYPRAEQANSQNVIANQTSLFDDIFDGQISTHIVDVAGHVPNYFRRFFYSCFIEEFGHIRRYRLDDLPCDIFIHRLVFFRVLVTVTAKASVSKMHVEFPKFLFERPAKLRYTT